MKSWIAVLGVAILAIGVVGISNRSGGMSVVSDQEAAALYGGCVDSNGDGKAKCGESGEGNCTLTKGPSALLTNGSGKEVSVNCGASACGTVSMTTCSCNG